MAISTADAGSKIAAIMNQNKAAEGQTDSATNEGKEAPENKKKPKKPAVQQVSSKKAPKEAKPAPQDDEDELADDGQEDEEGQTDGAETTEDDDETDDDEDDADQSDEDTDQDDAEDSEDGDDDEDREFTIKLDGKESQVTLKELIAGYQRNADYSRKTMALAKERKEIDALKAEVADLPEVRKTYSEQGEKFAKNAGLVMAALQTRFMPQPPTAELLASDPHAYYAQKELHQEALNLVGGLSQEMQRMEARQKEENAKAVQAGRAKLYANIPELNEPAKRAEFVGYIKALGFTDEQIKNEPNHVLFEFAHKAMKYDAIMKRKTEIKSDKSTPKVIKRTRSPDGKKTIVERERTQVRDNLKRTGSIDAGAKAIMQVRNRTQK